MQSRLTSLRFGWFRVCALAVLGCAVIPPTAKGQTETILHSFSNREGDGQNPIAGLIRDSAGNLYGTTEWGGGYGWGAVFKIDKTGNETVSYSFTGGIDGANPSAGLIRDAAGNLYGTALFGGANHCPVGESFGCGTVFKLGTTGHLTVLYTFVGTPDGAGPLGLIQDASGNFYGTTDAGGDSTNYSSGAGTVFKLDTTNKERVLYRFTGLSDGYSPQAGMVRDSKGNLFGTTYRGGDPTCGYYGCGIVFELDSSGTESVIYTFTGGADGDDPVDALDKDGSNLAGTTLSGGTYGLGTVFTVDQSGTETVLHNFTGKPDGSGPAANVVRDSKGNLYGTTYGGGDYNLGTVFKIDTTGKETVVYSFGNGADGKAPFAGLTLDSAGNLYGTTFEGGDANMGTVFKVTP
jgi:uncharacterized repeat protein (TIGR03803 family)